MSSGEQIARQYVEVHTSVKTVIIQPITTFSSMFLIYGMYIIIFGLSINILWCRRESPTSKAYMRWIIALFILITIYNAATIWLYMDQTLVAFDVVNTSDYIPLFNPLSGDSSPSGYAARIGLSSFASTIIGQYNLRLLAGKTSEQRGKMTFSHRPLPGFVVTAVMIGAYQHHDAVPYERSFNTVQVLVIITAVYTCLLTLLTAGRIWWITRQAGQITGTDISTKYKIFIATILEPGFLCSATLVVSVVLPVFIDPDSQGLAPFDFNVISVQMAAIAPTLIIVRIAYDQSVETVQQMVSALQFAEGGNNSQQRSTFVRGTIDLRRSLGDAEGRGTAGGLEAEKPPSNVAGSVVRPGAGMTSTWRFIELASFQTRLHTFPAGP
ncbi:hypothetical protein PM082_004493 [Marasmius tenuissimus]|nr:hypothetical protein PM082_004493 [Marasmius tenuissimus]